MSTSRRWMMAAAIVLAARVGTPARAGTNGADIHIVLDPSLPVYEPGQAITATIEATLLTPPPGDQQVLLRGIQLDFQQSTGVVLPDMMTFAVPQDYVVFPQLPRPAAIWPGTAPGDMLSLPLGTAVPLGAITFNAGEGNGALDIVNLGATDPNFGFDLTFGFGIEPNDPITSWRFDTGELTGDQSATVPVPEPATLLLLLVGAASVCRRRR
ncbi:MAG: PEP-CTERM sorting domain-containing protein [Phycisphaerae bacterium]